ncbi:MAG: hypothetical protein AB7F94_01820 [Nitrospira sp.]
MEMTEFRSKENWQGSFYELCLELGPAGSDTLAIRALEMLWRQPELHGPWVERSDYDPAANPVEPSIQHSTYYGYLTLTDRKEVGCASYLIRVEGESDWLNLSIPMGMLELRYPLSYPLDRSTNPWLEQVDELFARLARVIYKEATFQLGLVGEEASGANSAATLTKEDCQRGGLLVPWPLWQQLKPSREVADISNGLVHVPFIGPHITYGS